MMAMSTTVNMSKVDEVVINIDSALTVGNKVITHDNYL